MDKKQFRTMAISLLDDQHGLSQTGYDNLRDLSFDLAPDYCDDIWAATYASKGRVFLHEDHGIIA